MTQEGRLGGEAAEGALSKSGDEGISNQGPPKKAQEALKGVIEACGPRGEAAGGALSKIGVEGTNRQGPPNKAQEALKGVIEACDPRGEAVNRGRQVIETETQSKEKTGPTTKKVDEGRDYHYWMEGEAYKPLK